jgi:hypothetical protein
MSLNFFQFTSHQLWHGDSLVFGMVSLSIVIIGTWSVQGPL